MIGYAAKEIFTDRELKLLNAGKNRNRRMFRGFEPDGTVAFPGGDGTEDMVNVTIDGGAHEG